MKSYKKILILLILLATVDGLAITSVSVATKINIKLKILLISY